MRYFCCDNGRREEVRRAAVRAGDDALNGIDYLEVLDDEAPAVAPGEQSLRQRVLLVHFLTSAHLSLNAENFRVDGGERTPNVRVETVELPAQGPENVLEVRVDKYGDFSTYTLRLVTDTKNTEPPPKFDPMLSTIDFSFKVECPTEFDCEAQHVCSPEPLVEPEIDYLAKDYASFRRLMLDRMSTLMPQWRDRGVADVGVMLAEALAYVGDHLSYQQDAIATEAYLGTARRRVSVRRHARLVDYRMHEGCSARAWVQVQVSADAVKLPAATRLFSGMNHLPPRIDLTSVPDVNTLGNESVAFETAHPALLFSAHNELEFYTWSDRRCCLAKGATRATLMDDPVKRIRLCVGDVLMFVEKLGPRTGDAADADPRHRHAVRLTRVSPAAERAFGQGNLERENGKEIDRIAGPLVTDPLTKQAIVEIGWEAADALPFQLCISAVTSPDHGEAFRNGVSVALGNIVLVDHGLSHEPELLGVAPQPTLFKVREPGLSSCGVHERVPIAPRFNPRLARQPLTHAAPYDNSAPASIAMAPIAEEAVPAIKLESGEAVDTLHWSAQRDLLDSDPEALGFVTEIENDGIARLRFGDGRHGKRPPSGKAFRASYRVGNGTAGNVGADAITRIVSNEASIVGVTNPMPARGGVEPESLEEVRQRAPYAFRRQERAVTESDYAAIAEREPDVQRAKATFRWTGSWHTAFVTVDRQGGPAVDGNFEMLLRKRLEGFRLVGQDLEVDSPRFVPLEIEMHVCVKAGYFRSHVKAALLDLFSSRLLSDGRRGVFHPDNFTFGQPVYLSPLYALAQRVTGVASVHVTTFQRMGLPDPKPLLEGRLTLGRLEIARLDSDANFSERGVFRLDLGGGK